MLANAANQPLEARCHEILFHSIATEVRNAEKRATKPASFAACMDKTRPEKCPPKDAPQDYSDLLTPTPAIGPKIQTARPTYVVDSQIPPLSRSTARPRNRLP